MMGSSSSLKRKSKTCEGVDSTSAVKRANFDGQYAWILMLWVEKDQRNDEISPNFWFLVHTSLLIKYP